jgi:RNA polymerase sigma-70 factor (ECF subfamily)
LKSSTVATLGLCSASHSAGSVTAAAQRTPSRRRSRRSGDAIIDRSRARTEPPADAPDEPSPDSGPAELAEAGWTAWRIHRALEELSDNERTVIELAYWSGLSQSEIAEYLGIPLGTVKTRTRAALAHLADALEGELE